MELVRLGVSLFVGRHDFPTNQLWFLGWMILFGLCQQDIALTTTDSGANVRAGMLRLPPPWLACIAKFSHNSVQHALGAPTIPKKSGEQKDSDNMVTTLEGRSKNSQANVLAFKLRKPGGHSNHSERSVALYSEFNVPHPGRLQPGPCCWNVMLNTAVSPAAVKSKIQETRY